MRLIDAELIVTPYDEGRCWIDPASALGLASLERVSVPVGEAAIHLSEAFARWGPGGARSPAAGLPFSHRENDEVITHA
jgi:hypothetical protein